MNCNTAQNLLSAYIDSELSGGEMGRVRKHLGHCECCQREETELRMLKDLLNSNMPLIEPPLGFEDRLCQAIFSPKPSETAQMVGSWPFVSGVALVTAALTLIVLSQMGDNTQNVMQPQSVVAQERFRDQTLNAFDPYMDSRVVTTGYDGR
jgi:anti-sigma factor RsiW